MAPPNPVLGPSPEKAQPEPMAAAVPLVELPDDGHPLCARGPDGEVGSLEIAERARVRPEPLVEADVAPFVEEVEIVLPEERVPRVEDRSVLRCDAAAHRLASRRCRIPARGISTHSGRLESS